MDEQNTTAQISLHDCRAVSLTVEQGTLSFFIPSGIWIDGTVTGPANVIFVMTGEPVIYTFTDEGGETVRKQIKPEKLADKLARGKWELEFGYRYDNRYEAVITGWLWKKKRPYPIEIMMFLPISNTYYQTK